MSMLVVAAALTGFGVLLVAAVRGDDIPSCPSPPPSPSV